MNEFFDAGNYAFTMYWLPVAFVGLMAATLGLATLARERGSAVSVTFMVMELSSAIWLIGFAGCYATTDPEVALAWLKVMFFGLAFLPTAVLAFAFAVTNRFERYWPVILVCALISALSLGINTSTEIFTDHVRHYFWGYNAMSRPALFPFAIFETGCLIVAAIVLRSAQQSTRSPTQRRRVTALLVALSIAYLASVDWLPSTGVEVYPFGYVFIGIFILMTTRALWRYRLVDVTPALAANQIIETMGGALLVLDSEDTIRIANQAAADMLGTRRDKLIGRPFLDAQRPPFSEVNERQTSSVEINYGEGAEERIAVVSSSVLNNRAGDDIGTVYIAHDISERKRAEQALHKSEALYRTLIETSPETVIVTDQQGVIVMANRRTKELLRVETVEALLGRNALDFVIPEDRERLRESFAAALGAHVVEIVEFTLIRQDGETFPAELSVSRLLDEAGEASGFIAIARDVTERKSSEATIRHLAFHDPLTGLANRSLLMEELARAAIRLDSQEGKLALLYMDLDGMKGVNDRFGHSTGDQVLRIVAQRMERLIRAGDVLARVGGDEFVLVLNDLSCQDQAVAVAQRILEAVSEPFAFGGTTSHLSASIGIAIYPDAGRNIEALLSHADAAMYEAKEHGGNFYQIAPPAGGEVPVAG
ncbi:MAG: diguanylate cyclase [Dehalococcoidia bacterium]